MLRHVPVLQCVKQMVVGPVLGPYSEQLSQKTKVIPLPIVFKNEQKYHEVVDIMDTYEELIKEVYRQARADASTVRIHIGGDQLTRERFSGAKTLRIGAVSPRDRFEHLSPITFELFHMLMNFLMVFFKRLYKDDSTDQVGTMKAEAIRISRSNVDSDVRKAYDADRDFVLSFVDAYIVEAVLEYFGMEDVYSYPTRHPLPSDQQDDCAMKEWFSKHFKGLVEEMVAPNFHHVLNALRRDGPKEQLEGKMLSQNCCWHEST